MGSGQRKEGIDAHAPLTQKRKKNLRKQDRQETIQRRVVLDIKSVENFSDRFSTILNTRTSRMGKAKSERHHCTFLSWEF